MLVSLGKSIQSVHSKILMTKFLFQSQIFEVVVSNNIWKKIGIQSCVYYEFALWGAGWCGWDCTRIYLMTSAMPSLPPGLLLFISIFSRQKSELFLKKGDVIHSVPPSLHWLFYPALELNIFATCATAEMCTAAADNCTPLLCNKPFGKMYSLSSILTLLLVFLTIVAWMKAPSPTVLRKWYKFKRGCLSN